MSELSSSLYWSLPGPQNFCRKVTDAARVARALILSFPQNMPANPIRSPELERALANANIESPVTLRISDGMNISVGIGTQFNTPNISAQALAHHNHGAQHAIILQAIGKRAQEQCEKYVGEFVSSINDSDGDVRLIIAISSGEYTADEATGGIQIIAFDGWLNPSEIEAYVSMRMVNYTGPGSTSLYKHLVTEFSSFDPNLAETLSQMEPSHLLNLPKSLSDVMGANPLRWSRHSWLNGTLSQANHEMHPLHEWYCATHSGANSAAMQKAAQRRYWRACLKSIIPWLEERRHQVLDVLDRQWKQVEWAAGGHDKIQKKIGSEIIRVDRYGLEYGDVVFQSRSLAFNTIPTLEPERMAVSICSMAKDVRDDISHLRPPNTEQVMALITTMDSLLATQPPPR